MAVMVRRERSRGKGRHCRLSWWHGASEGILKHALNMLMHEMGAYTTESLEASRFLALLIELLTSGRAQLLTYPETPVNEAERERMIGWQNKDGSVYLLPDLAREAVERMIGRESLGALSDRTLHSQLASLKMLKSQDAGRFTVNRKIQGKSTRLLHLTEAAITGPSDSEGGP
jgi:hypothetical protein